MLLKIQDLVPFIIVEIGMNSWLSPVSELLLYPFPLNTAVVFPASTVTTFLFVTNFNLTLSDENKVLPLQITPLEFYEGDMLKDFANDDTLLTLPSEEKIQMTGV